MVPAPLHHPSDATLLSRAAGGLSAAHCLVVDIHAERCAACRETISLCTAVGGILLGGLAPAPLLVARPAPGLAWLYGELARKRASRWLGPGIRHIALLSEPAGRLHLLQVAPGQALPHHTHVDLELTYVLEGSFADGTGSYGSGDVQEVDQTDAHEPVATGDRDCICLIAISGRLRFSRWAARLLQPLLPF